jgi:hypothetical protein
MMAARAAEEIRITSAKKSPFWTRGLIVRFSSDGFDGIIVADD